MEFSDIVQPFSDILHMGQFSDIFSENFQKNKSERSFCVVRLFENRGLFEMNEHSVWKPYSNWLGCGVIKSELNLGIALNVRFLVYLKHVQFGEKKIFRFKIRSTKD